MTNCHHPDTVTKVYRIGILTAGGDCPGLNATIVSLVDNCKTVGYVPVLIRGGFAGLLDEASGTPGTVTLDAITFQGLARRGGTVLGASRADLHADSARTAAQIGAAKLKLDALVVIGGDGSLASARLLSPYLPVVAIPKTIDNDVACTETSLGFATAVQTAFDAVEKLQDTAASHTMRFVVEIMGRSSGFLAAETARAAQVDGVIVPEHAWSMYKLLNRFPQNKGGVVLVAEGAISPKLILAPDPATPSPLIKNIGVAQNIVNSVPDNMRATFRAVVLGHLCRGGSPVAADRLLASRFAACAFEKIQAKVSAVCVVRAGVVQAVDIGEIDKGRKFLSKTDLAELGTLLIGC